MLERDVVKSIFKNVLKPLGDKAFFFKVHGSMFQKAGIPDIIGCYLGRFVAIECKRPGEEPTLLQMATMATLRKAGAFVTVATCDEDVRVLIREIDAKAA